MRKSSVGNAKIPEWVGTEKEQLKPSSAATFRSKAADGSPDSWYVTRYPIVVAAKEWVVERSTAMMPSRKKKSIIRIEIRRKADQPLGIHGYRDLEEGSVLSDWNDIISEGDIIIFNILRPENDNKLLAKASSFTKDLIKKESSSESLSTLGFKGADGPDNDTPLTEAWTIKHSAPISKTSMKRNGARCNISIESITKVAKNEYTMSFSSEAEAKSFIRFVSEVKSTHVNLAQNSIKNTIDTRSVNTHTSSIDFLIEIISATDLKPLKRFGSRNSYVSVHYGGKKIHQTEVEKNTLDPIWTIKSNSMFMFTLYPEEYYNSDLLFEVRDFSQTMQYKTLGTVFLSTNELIKANGERIVKSLKDLNVGKNVQGYLAIRCRRANQNDKDFFDAPQKKQMAVKRRLTSFTQPLYSKQNPTLQMERKKTINGKNHYFVRPMDPSGKITYLTKDQMNETCKLPSQNWTVAGSGELGELYLEILSCDDLPNLDIGLPRNKTDAFANIVFEDAIMSTEVVRDTLNPRFMPWTRRAFKLNVHDLNSRLYIGVFDHDFRGLKYDPIGRVAIPLHRFTPGTVYNLSYDLYDSSEVTKRHVRGQINIRMSIKWKGQRSLFFNSLTSQEEFTVNFESKRDYDHAEYTVQGYDDQREYNLKTILGYVEELTQYQSVLVTITEGLKTVIFWRGHFDFKFLFCIKLKLPLHSMTMLAFGIVLTEFPQYSVSVFFASIAWFMLGLLDNSYKRPSLWHRPPLFKNLFLRLLTGGCRPTTIDPMQYKEEDDEYMDIQNARVEKYKKMSKEFWADVPLDDVDEDLDDTKMKVLHKEALRNSMNPMKMQMFMNQLFPVQRLLADVVHGMRLAERLLSWDLR